MNVLLLCMGTDASGGMVSIVNAFDGHPGWAVHSMASSANYMEYPTDLAWDLDTLAAQWLSADVVHLQKNVEAAERLTEGWKHYRLPLRPLVVTFPGSEFRDDPLPGLADLRRHHALGIVTTLDLWLIAPGKLHWIPLPMQERTRLPRDDDTIRIAHAPTNRDVKSTGKFLQAIHRLQKDGYPVEAELIEHVSWAECLARKATADIYFDQVLLGYGNNAIEAWGMGIPVVAGGADPTLDEMERRFGELPFHHATENTIYEALKELVESPGLRAEMGQRGLEHVRRFHDERVVVEQLKALYLKAAGVKEQAA